MPRCADQELKVHDVAEEDVVRLAQQGNAAAFEQLYRRYSGRVYSLCVRIVKNDCEAEDLTQEAFLQVFRKIHTFRGEARFSTWLHRLATNVALVRLRKQRHLEVPIDVNPEQSEEESAPLMEHGGPDLRLTGVLDRLNLRRAVDELPEGYREMFILHDVEGYEHHEIAKILGCSSGNSKSQLYKARLRLRELLQESLRSQAREKRQSTHRSLVSEHRHYKFQCAKA